MEDQVICVIFAFIIIYILLYFLNKFMNKTNENFGIYCGRYKTDKTNCNLDKECTWITYKSRDKKIRDWCDQAGLS